MSNNFKFKMLKAFQIFFGIKNYLSKPRTFVKEKIDFKLSHDHFININNSKYNFLLKNPSLSILIDSFHRYGYLKVTNKCKKIPDEIQVEIDELRNFKIDFENLPTFLSNVKSFDEMIEILSKIYCGEISAEFNHLDNADERNWFDEKLINRESYEINSKEKEQYLRLILKAEELDLFLAKKFQSVKRYSGEGAESTLVCLHETLVTAARNNIKSVIISMAHRTRNNVLTVLLDYPPVRFFRKMLGKSEFPNEIKGVTGDTFSHYFTTTDWMYENQSLHVSLIPNPSHLEANIPVGAGKARSKMRSFHEGDYSKDGLSRNGDNVLPIFVHGDASVCGQGIVPETLVMCNSDKFSLGGSIHIIINNHIGFTTETPPGPGNVSDVAKIINCPVIHVDGFKVDDVARAAILAMEFRQKFRKDVFINLLCYRRWGHNELDDPTITQPVMYASINSGRSLVDTFLATFSKESIQNNVRGDVEQWTKTLNEHLLMAGDHNPELNTFKNQWRDMRFINRAEVNSLGVYDTGYDIGHLRQLGKMSVFVPQEFAIHKNVFKSHIQRRLERMDSSQEMAIIDWATAEALAIGSLLSEGYHCRISGQDVGRGTFNQRHLELTHQTTNKSMVPFNECPWPPCFSNRGCLEVANSILSEEAVLGFEVGMALDDPNQLCIWEAQFGDFFNGAQIIVDTYLGSGETKWMLQNGLVMLLPHGYDGAGPEHSSCRLERFLQLTDSSETCCDSESVNIHIVNPSTPAQYFHVLRRQMVRPFRRPLVVVAPKMLLRSPVLVSAFRDLDVGTHFHHVLPHPGPSADPKSVTSVILCSGKHFYTLKQFLDSEVGEGQRGQFALLRIEQLTPFPVSELKELMSKYTNCTRFVWSQEEPRNMGAWSFVEARVRNILGVGLQYVGRRELAAPATGIGQVYKQEVLDINRHTFGL